MNIDHSADAGVGEDSKSVFNIIVFAWLPCCDRSYEEWGTVFAMDEPGLLIASFSIPLKPSCQPEQACAYRVERATWATSSRLCPGGH